MPQSVKVETSGPFFNDTEGAKQAVSDSIHELVNEGERAVKLDLTPGHGLKTGHYRSSIHGESTDWAHGVIDDSNVIYGPWLEGVGSRNEKSRFKGYTMFRRATQKLNDMAQRTVDAAVAKLVGKLNG
jgi:hypothetical protein